MAGDREKAAEGEQQSRTPPPRPAAALERVAAAVEAVAASGEFRNAYRRQLLALSRRIRLLGPFAEELRERRRTPAPRSSEERALAPLAGALEKALELLRLGREGSRISLARITVSPMQRDMRWICHGLKDWFFSRAWSIFVVYLLVAEGLLLLVRTAW